MKMKRHQPLFLEATDGMKRTALDLWVDKDVITPATMIKHVKSYVDADIQRYAAKQNRFSNAVAKLTPLAIRLLDTKVVGILESYVEDQTVNTEIHCLIPTYASGYQPDTPRVILYFTTFWNGYGEPGTVVPSDRFRAQQFSNEIVAALNPLVNHPFVAEIQITDSTVEIKFDQHAIGRTEILNRGILHYFK